MSDEIFERWQRWDVGGGIAGLNHVDGGKRSGEKIGAGQDLIDVLGFPGLGEGKAEELIDTGVDLGAEGARIDVAFVLCEARMARNASEAYTMLAAAQANPHLIAQIVPAPMTLSLDRTVQALIKDGYLGEVLAIEHRDCSGFVDFDAPMSWRRHRHYSGKNIMGLGIVYETIMRWVGTATEVMAIGQVNVKTRFNPETNKVEAVHIPDHLNVLAKMACGAQCSLSFSQVTGLAGDNHMTLYGSEGTLRIQDGKLFGGERNDRELTEIPPHPEFAGDGWRVEADFIDSIRGLKPVTLTNFDDGVRYMEFVEAVTLSMQSDEAVSLPL